MRYGRLAVAAVALLTVVLAVAATEPAELAPSPQYEFEIIRTSTGIELECHHGCNWMTLTGKCDQEYPNCTYVVDERGIRVLPDPDMPDQSPSGN